MKPYLKPFNKGLSRLSFLIANNLQNQHPCQTSLLALVETLPPTWQKGGVLRERSQHLAEGFRISAVSVISRSVFEYRCADRQQSQSFTFSLLCMACALYFPPVVNMRFRYSLSLPFVCDFQFFLTHSPVRSSTAVRSHLSLCWLLHSFVLCSSLNCLPQSLSLDVLPLLGLCPRGFYQRWKLKSGAATSP